MTVVVANNLTAAYLPSSVTTPMEHRGKDHWQARPPKQLRETTTSASSKTAKLKRHRHYYLPDGNVVIQVENTLFRLSLSALHENSQIFKMAVPPPPEGKVVPVVGFNDRRPLVLREITEVDFVRLLAILFPLPANQTKKLKTVDALLSVLKLATKFQMERVCHAAMLQLHELPIDPIRKIAIWEEFHLDLDLLLPAYATLCQRSEPLTLSMTMSLGIRNFTKVAASRDLYRQRVGCCRCRESLSQEESQKIANEIVLEIFGKRQEIVE